MAASPDRVWALVSDVTRIGEFSPETFEAEWLDGATGPEPGARFRGHVRRNGRGPVYWTTCTVTAADAGKNFAFEVTYGPLAISTWEYTFTPNGDNTTVVEEWTDRRPLWMKIGSGPVMGVADRAAHNRRGMEHTLEKLKVTAES